MQTDYEIKHKDIVKVGYLFLEKAHEEVFLSKVNEELSQRVRNSMLTKLRLSKHIKDQHIFNDLVIKQHIKDSPEHLAIVKKIRKNLLKELSVQRKKLMLSGTNIEIPQENKVGGILYSETNVP